MAEVVEAQVILIVKKPLVEVITWPNLVMHNK